MVSIYSQLTVLHQFYYKSNPVFFLHQTIFPSGMELFFIPNPSKKKMILPQTLWSSAIT